MAEIRINATGGIKLYDADDSHYAQIVAGTITSNVDAITLGHDTVTIADNLSLGSDSAVLKFGADGDTTLTHTDGTGLTLNSTNKICFNDASQFIQGSSNAVLSLGATDEIDLTATAVDLNGTLNVSGVATFQSNPVFPDGSLALADLDIDGGTDIGAAIVDADLFIVDDGAGGTNRKVTASRIKTYAGGASALGSLDDVSMDITNFTDGLLIQTQTDGSAPGTGTLSSATGNIGIGKDVFAALTSGDYNVGIGYGALAAHTTGSTVIAIGKNAMAAATTMGSSLAIGSGALDGSDTENDNLAIGINALGATLSGGEKNIAIGDSVLDAVTSGDNNTAMGRASATAITTGSHNIVVGGDAAAALVDGSYNTFLGSNACNDMTTGDQNVFIGYDCKGESGSTDHDNQIVIGGTNLRGIGDNNFTFGKGSGADRVYNAFTSNASWTRSSDVRYKKNIEDNEDCGLDFINDLRPVTFRWKAKSEIDSDLPDYDKTELKPEYDKKLYGLIAQEVKTSLDKYGIKDFGGWKEVNDGIQCISQEMFVHPLIKAVQELSAEVKELKAKLEDK